MYSCMHTYIYVCAYIYIYMLRECVYIHICIYIYIYICACAYIHIYTCIHIHICEHIDIPDLCWCVGVFLWMHWHMYIYVCLCVGVDLEYIASLHAHMHSVCLTVSMYFCVSASFCVLATNNEHTCSLRKEAGNAPWKASAGSSTPNEANNNTTNLPICEPVCECVCEVHPHQSHMQAHTLITHSNHLLNILLNLSQRVQCAPSKGSVPLGLKLGGKNPAQEWTKCGLGVCHGFLPRPNLPLFFSTQPHFNLSLLGSENRDRGGIQWYSEPNSAPGPLLKFISIMKVVQGFPMH